MSLLRVNFRLGTNDMAGVFDWLMFSLAKKELIASDLEFDLIRCPIFLLHRLGIGVRREDTCIQASIDE